MTDDLLSRQLCVCMAQITNLNKSFIMLYDEYKRLRTQVDELKGVKRPVHAVMVPMFSKKGGLTNE